MPSTQRSRPRVLPERRVAAALLAAAVLLGTTVMPGLAAQRPGSAVSVIVRVAGKVDLTSLRGLDRAARQENAVRALRDNASRRQAGLLVLLATGQRNGTVTTFESLWAINAIALTAQSDLIASLATRPDVVSITPDAQVAGPAPLAASGSSVEANIALIGAPDLWAQGFDGSGIVVASLDSGVDATHPDLAAKWRGGSNSWFDPNGQHPTTPTDLTGHGTGTMGVMVGGSSGGSQIGVAPGAKWIAAKIFNDAGYATTSGIHLAYQWLLDPDGDPTTADGPDVVNNSWTSGAPGCSLEFEPDLAALRGAGILPVFAAGNTGPGSSTSVSPANNPSAFSVGSIDNDSAIDPSSAHGPTSCGQSSTTYPSVVAPGVSIRTDDRYGLFQTLTGTSLAAPHVAGAVALLRQAYPGLDPSLAAAALRATAVDLGASGADNTYGAGRLDVAAAAAWLQGVDATPPSLGNLAASPSPSSGAAAISITATAADPGSGGTGIARAEWWVGPDPGPGHGTAMGALDGAFGGATESLTGTLATAGRPNGDLLIKVRARDGAGNWSPTSVVPVIITPADAIFADGFESGTVGSWSGSSGGSRITVTADAAAAGRWGLATTINGKSAAYVVDASPLAEPSAHVRFTYASRDFATAGRTVDVLVGLNGSGKTILTLQYRRSTSGVSEIRLGVLSSNKMNFTSWTALDASAHAVEIAWASAIAATATVWVDGTQRLSLSKLNTGAMRLEEIRLGPSGGLAANTAGTPAFDRYVTTRTSLIGP